MCLIRHPRTNDCYRLLLKDKLGTCIIKWPCACIYVLAGSIYFTFAGVTLSNTKLWFRSVFPKRFCPQTPCILQKYWRNSQKNWKLLSKTNLSWASSVDFPFSKPTPQQTFTYSSPVSSSMMTLVRSFFTKILSVYLVSATRIMSLSHPNVRGFCIITTLLLFCIVVKRGLLLGSIVQMEWRLWITKNVEGSGRDLLWALNHSYNLQLG